LVTDTIALLERTLTPEQYRRAGEEWRSQKAVVRDLGNSWRMAVCSWRVLTLYRAPGIVKRYISFPERRSYG
jgi:hypothetical protein